MSEPVSYRLPDEQPTPDRSWWPGLVFVLVVFVLLSNPLLSDPLPMRVGRVVVWLLQAAGLEFGPLQW